MYQTQRILLTAEVFIRYKYSPKSWLRCSLEIDSRCIYSSKHQDQQGLWQEEKGRPPSPALTSVVRPLLQQGDKLLGNTPLFASYLYPCYCASVRHHGTLYRRPYEEMRFVTTAVRFPCRALVNIVVLKPEVYWECRHTGNEEGLDNVRPYLPSKLYVNSYGYIARLFLVMELKLEDCVDDTQEHYD